MVVKLLEHPTAFTLSYIEVKNIQNVNSMRDIIKSMKGYLEVDVLTDYIPAIRELLQANLIRIDYFKFENVPLYLTLEAA